jgi:orotate phosphoribosyltransferase
MENIENGVSISFNFNFSLLEPREQLLTLVKEMAVVHGDFVLSSGKQASYYIDLRRVTLHHLGAPLIGHLLLDTLEEAGFVAGDGFAAVGGLTLGADPIATAVLHCANARGIDIDAFVVRKAAKAHGMQRQIEGPDIAGRDVVIVEDTTTTGGSPIVAIEAARAAGANVQACATIVDRNTGAAEIIESKGVPYISLFSLADVGL